MLKNLPKIIMPTLEEEASIQAAIASDPDTWEAGTLTRARRGRPKGSGTKAQATVSLDCDLLAALRASGRGWQTRMNEVLRKEFM